MEKCTGAGIIVFFDNRGIRHEKVKGLEENILYLFMKGLDGFYDFPKGSIDEGEFPLDCAIRETYEEINLKSDDYVFVDNVGKSFFSEKQINNHVLRMYIAEIKKDCLYKPMIRKNPHTGILEHKSFTLSSKEKKYEMLLPYLKNPLDWAENVILQSFKT
jgi:8-oxo-dGTP pyrophosphatase MutT (NUDIX family)